MSDFDICISCFPILNISLHYFSPSETPWKMKCSPSSESLQTYEHVLHIPQQLLYLHLSIYTILLKFFLFLTCWPHKILFFYILVQIQYGIYNSLKVCAKLLMSFIGLTSFAYLVAVSRPQLYYSKGGFILKDSTLKLYRTPRLSGGFLTKKRHCRTFMLQCL